jgi:Papain family cysteine protease
MPTKLLRGLDLILDARPDRVDTRDLQYQPPLVSLPQECPDAEFIKKHYRSYARFILDQGKEGACTGFGLAAMINYLLWKRDLLGKKVGPVARVSPAMLYHMARLYDEWAGEDYEGSSCRGAMKGWHRHGVCGVRLWPRGKKFVRPQQGWQQDAATRPLGAYYRINKDSVLDLQSAIHEVGAIYVSGEVSDSWDLWETKTLSVIPDAKGDHGGHAFALVGYTPHGFIVQNSWGPTWGFHGFAVMSYQDWIDHGSDAWVAVLGAPMLVARGSPEAKARTRRSVSIRDAIGGKAEWSWRSDSVAKPERATPPLGEGEAYEHSVVLGNDGLPINRFVDCADSVMAVEETALRLPLDWLKKHRSKKLALYAHGGLNSEEASLKRIRILTPFFLENDIYPLFFTWRTGALESIESILADSVERFFSTRDGEPARGFFEAIKNQLADAKDRSIEVACESLLVKPIWSQMKQNAKAAEQFAGGLTLVAGHLLSLSEEIPGLELHLAGHSAGSILLGHMLPMLIERKIPVESCTLFAPACTVSFALQYYQDAIQRKLFSLGRFVLHVMSDAREQADTVGPYGKSLLYLVSRALEDVHKMPLLGMEGAWRDVAADFWHPSYAQDVAQWRSFAKKARLIVHDEADVNDGVGQIPLAHGSFDNDLSVITSLLEDMRGEELAAAVDNLHGF